MTQSSKAFKVFIFSVSMVMLCGCASREQLQAMERQRYYQEQQVARQFVERLASKCDSYGFKRGTTQFSQCLQQAEQQETMNQANQMQQNQIDRQNQQRLFQKAQCFSTGRLDC